MYTFFIVLICISACKTSNAVDSSEKISENVDNQKIQKYCPNDGDCSIKLHKNSSLILKKDTTDALYPVIEEGGHTVVVFEFSRKGAEGTADGDYSETIHFEIKEITENLTVEGEKLAEVNMLFGKQCFCRGEAGFYKVNDGNLILQKSNNEITIDLLINLTEVSHRITRVKEKIKL
ncbi:hypothetical protein ABW637_07565 [Aquimarina sp. 2304DJ70-9]